jgi:hypothetical protein
MPKRNPTSSSDVLSYLVIYLILWLYIVQIVVAFVLCNSKTAWIFSLTVVPFELVGLVVFLRCYTTNVGCKDFFYLNDELQTILLQGYHFHPPYLAKTLPNPNLFYGRYSPKRVGWNTTRQQFLSVPHPYYESIETFHCFVRSYRYSYNLSINLAALMSSDKNPYDILDSNTKELVKESAKEIMENGFKVFEVESLNEKLHGTGVAISDFTGVRRY